MSDLDFKIDVDGVERTIKRLEDDLRDGIEDGIDDLLDLAEDEAQDTIRLHDRIFNREVYQGFQATDAHFTSPTSAQGSIRNTAPHAPVVEYGASYNLRGPPVQALIPWVKRNLSGWSIGDGGGGSGTGTASGSSGSPQIAGPSGPQNLPSTTADPDWRRFDVNESVDVDDLWIGQNVTIYDRDEGTYKDGTVDKLSAGRGDGEVITDDGSSYPATAIYPAHSDSTIVAGEDWSSLPDDAQADLIKQMSRSEIELRTSDSVLESELQDALDQYADRWNSKTKVKRMVLGLKYIEEDNALGALGQFQPDGVGGGTIKVDPSAFFFDRATQFHELFHALSIINDTDYTVAARHRDLGSGEDWDLVKKYGNNNLEGYLNYDARGESNWETSKGSMLPHPTNYLIHDYTQVKEPGLYEEPNAPGFDTWQAYVRKKTKYDLQNFDGSATFDESVPEQQVFDPNMAYIGNGDAIKFDAAKPSTPNGATTEFKVKVESEVYKKQHDSGYAIDISAEGHQDSLRIDSNGNIDEDHIYYKGVALGGGDSIDDAEYGIEEGDIPDDPGFNAPESDTWNRFREGINRQEWREMIINELGSQSQIADRLLRGDNYSTTNAQETGAAAIEAFFATGSSTDALEKMVTIYDNSPLLLWAASQEIDITKEAKEYLEKEVGRDWDDILSDIYREYLD
jgi:hypothetical protein